MLDYDISLLPSFLVNITGMQWLIKGKSIFIYKPNNINDGCGLLIV